MTPLEAAVFYPALVVVGIVTLLGFSAILHRMGSAITRQAIALEAHVEMFKRQAPKPTRRGHGNAFGFLPRLKRSDPPPADPAILYIAPPRSADGPTRA